MPRALREVMSGSYRLVYAAGGAIVSIAAPAGVVMSRLASGSASSIRSELVHDGLTYACVAIASAIAVAAFGYAVGCRAELFRRLATIDPLTGLLNRRAIEERLRNECERASRYGLPLSLLLIDLDGLKSVNDRGGHSSGDRVLRGAAAAIQSTLRATDYGGRWGGDEFVVVAPHTSRQAARQLGERVAQRISARARADRLLATASIGVATFERGVSLHTSASAFVDEADRALYAAKAGGRSRVIAS